MSVNLLEKVREKQIESVDGLSISEHDEEKALELAGFRHVLNRNKTKRMEYSVLKKYGPLVRLKDIEAIAKKYDLRFDVSSRFMGDPGPETAQKIHEFMRRHPGSKATEIVIRPFSREKMEHTRFYILGLPELFEKPVPADPVLFYHVDGDLYALIDQWGGELNSFRAVTTFLKRWHGTISAIGLVASVVLAFAFHFAPLFLVTIVCLVSGIWSLVIKDFEAGF